MTTSQTAAVRAASAIGAAARRPLSDKAGQRLRDFWGEHDKIEEDFDFLLVRIAKAGPALRERLGDDPWCGREGLSFLHDHVEAGSKKSTAGPTRYCLEEFNWLAEPVAE